VTDDNTPAFAIDPRLERVADGSLPAEELTPNELHMRQLMSAASGPALPDELAGKERVMAAYASAISTPTAGAAGASWVMNRPQRRSGRRTGAAAAAAVTAVLLSGVAAAAATGTLPAPLQHAVHHAWGGTNATRAGGVSGAHTHGSDASEGASETDSDATESADTSSEAADPSSTGPRSSSHATGVPAAGTAGSSAAALCRAWTVQHGQVNPQSALARSLVSLAGGSGQVTAYCQTVLAAPHGHSASSTPDASSSSHGNGTNQGNGTAKGHSSAGASGSSHASNSGHADAKPSPSNASSNKDNGGSNDHQHP
jgi:hypothetical protein